MSEPSLFLTEFSLSPFGSSKVQVGRKGKRKGYYVQFSENFNALLRNVPVLMASLGIYSLGKPMQPSPSHCSLTQETLSPSFFPSCSRLLPFSLVGFSWAGSINDDWTAFSRFHVAQGKYACPCLTKWRHLISCLLVASRLAFMGSSCQPQAGTGFCLHHVPWTPVSLPDALLKMFLSSALMVAICWFLSLTSI